MNFLATASGPPGRPPRPPALWPTAAGLPELRPGDCVHLVGAGGAGMSGLGRMLLAAGLKVTGSDRSESTAVRELVQLGAEIVVGHNAANLPEGCRLLVMSPAIAADNPELVLAEARGVPITKRAVLMGALLDARQGVAVAGTHGKTTTTAMLATMASVAGLAPSYCLGAPVAGLGPSAQLGSGAHFILEADEYDRSFLQGHPHFAVITTLEHDHPDQFPTEADVVSAFGEFAARVRPDGRLLIQAANANSAAAASHSAAPVETFALEGTDGAEAATWQARSIALDTAGSAFEILGPTGQVGRVQLPMPGAHNVANALAAAAVGIHMGVGYAAISAALADFRGPERRFQPAGGALGVTLIDDYAHHPTEIGATLEAARQAFPGRRLWAVVEPHTYSRLAALADDFAASLAAADRAVITPVYAAREAPVPGVESRELAALAGPHVVAAGGLDEAGRLVAAESRSGDVAVFMGAGDIRTARRSALAALVQKGVARVQAQAEARGLGGDVLGPRALAGFTSLRVGGPADLVVRVTSTQDLAGWWLAAHTVDVPVRVLGRGTNVLVADAGLPGLVIINRCEAFSVAAAGDTAWVEAESGVGLAALAHAVGRQGWSGLEAAVGIPGSVGGAVATNAGAHDWCMADSLVAVDLVDRNGARSRLAPAELDMGYRTSSLKGDITRLVTGVRLELVRKPADVIRATVATWTAHRRQTQPASPSVGSIFKNPAGHYAGQLIEQAGLKGEQSGGARISNVHANFFVNAGGARADDLVRLIRLAKAAVRGTSGIELELEIEPMGLSDAELG